MRRLISSLPFVPLLLSGAPRSFLAHDEGYYALQARWALEQQEWLTPLWLGAPAFDRTMTVQWLIALAYRLLGVHPWVAHLPSLVAAAGCLGLTLAIAEELRPRLGLGPAWPWLSALVLACTPLWLNYAHLATQDLPLLAVEALAVAQGRTTLVLETISGSAAARLYERAGWEKVGDIPAYALMPDGEVAPTTFYTKRLA
jgi:4-amino-4-deoxy-L-arabinose transferase-like glycosyltransferase